MTSLKFYAFTWIKLCFFSMIIFRCRCENVTNDSEYATFSNNTSQNDEFSILQNDTTSTNTPPNNYTSIPPNNYTSIPPNNITTTTTSSVSYLTDPTRNPSDDRSKNHDDHMDPIFLWLLFGLLFISFCGLGFGAYFLYLKTLEVRSKLCPCRTQQLDLSADQSRGTPEPRYTLDPITFSKLLSSCNISISANSLNTTSMDPATNPNQRNRLTDQYSKKRFSFRGKKRSSANRDDEIATWNVYKYLEYLKKKNEHVYDEPRIQEPQYDNLTGLMAGVDEASTSGRSLTIASQHVPSFMLMNEIKNKKGLRSSPDRF